MITDRFGFLPCDWTFKFDGGEISPIREITKIRKRVEKLTNPDGFLYAPRSYRVTLDPTNQKKSRKVPGSERPALLHPVPPSHQLKLSAPGNQEELRKGAGSFLMHLLAYLFGVRLQFHDWWFDSRVPIKLFQTHNTHVRQETLENFLSHAYKTWRNWGPIAQRLTTNLLFMHSRTPSYEWDWERFAMEYMVLDGCWRLAELINGIKAKYHSERIEALCRKFGIAYEENRVKRLVTLRNELFHETLWDSSQPCTAVAMDTFMKTHDLRQFNQRLIPALLGYNNRYVHTIWWSRGAFPFDRQ
jgi:hypothetical protein